MSKKTECIKQMLENGTTYTFTLNPKFQAPEHNTLHRDRHIVNHVLNDILKTLNGTCKYLMYPEFAPKTGRFHYHGTITIDDNYEFYLRLPKVLTMCSIEIDIINDKDKWDKYILKDKKSMQPPLLKRKIPYKLTNETTYNYPPKQQKQPIRKPYFIALSD